MECCCGGPAAVEQYAIDRATRPMQLEWRRGAAEVAARINARYRAAPRGISSEGVAGLLIHQFDMQDGGGGPHGRMGSTFCTRGWR